MTELEEIIQKMIDAGESEESIDMIIKEYKSRNKTEMPKKEIDPVVADQAAESKEVTGSNLENGSSEQVSDKQALFNYKQRTGEEAGSIMNLSDDDYVLKGPRGFDVNSNDTFSRNRTRIDEIQEDRKKLESKATLYSYNNMPGLESVEYVKDQLEIFDKASAAEIKIMEYNPEFKLRNEAIGQLSKNTGNNQATGDPVDDLASEFNILNLFKGKSYYKNQEASEIVSLNKDVENAVVAKLDNKQLQKLAGGFYTLEEKENLIKEVKTPIVAKKIKEIKNLNTESRRIAETEIEFINKSQEAVKKSISDLTNGEMSFGKDSNPTKEQVNEYNSLVETLDGIKEQGESVIYDYNKQISANESVLKSFEGDYGVDLAVGTINNKFKLSDDAQKFREKYSGEGFWNATGDIVGGDLVQSLYQMTKKGTAGATAWALTSFGDVFQDQDSYSSFDAFSDVVDQWGNKTLVPRSTSSEFNITKEEGGFKDFEARNYAKLGVSMIPFTAYLISEVRKGKFKGLKEAVGNTYMKLGAKGKVLAPASQKLKDNIIMMDATFRATIMDNQKEGEKLGLNGLKATSYATVKSSTEALVQMIMPDTQFLKGIEGKAIKDVFVGSLKKAATKEGFKTAGKQYLTNIGKELGEEELNAGANLVTDAAYGIALPKASEFMNNQIELVAGTLMLSGSMGISGAAKTFSNQRKLIYNQIQGNITSLNLQLTTMAQKVKDPEVKKQLIEARRFALDIGNAIESSPENVTADQIELLVQKKKLIEKKSKTDSAFHQAINNKIEEIDTKIENSGIKRDTASRFDKDIENFSKSLISIGQKIDETIIFEDNEKGSADDQMRDFLLESGESKKSAEENKDNYGAFVVKKDGKEILVVNKASALKDRVVTTGQHEFLHKLLRASLNSNPEMVTKAGKLLLKELKSSTGKDSKLARRIDDYATDAEVTDAQFFEEILPLFSEALTNNEVKINDSSLGKISEFFRRVFQNIGFKNINFKTSEGVVNFIKDYNKAYSKGKFKGSLKGLAGSGKGKIADSVNFSKSLQDLKTELEDLIDDEFSFEDEADFSAQKSNLEFKIRKAEEKGDEKPVKKATVKEKIEKSADEVFKEEVKPKEPTAISDKSLKIAKKNTEIAEEMLALGANKLSEIEDVNVRKRISDKLIENNMGAVGELAKKSAFVGKSLDISDDARVGFEDFKAGYNEQLVAIANSYKVKTGDKVVPFGAYMKPILRLRYGQILDEAIKGKLKNTSSMSDERTLEVAEGMIEDTSGSSDQVIDVEQIDVRKTPIVASKISEIENAINLSDVDVSKLTYASTGDMFIDNVAQALLGISGDKASGKVTVTSKKVGEIDSGAVTAMQSLFKSTADVKRFIAVMPEYNITTNEAIINKQGEKLDVSKEVKGVSLKINSKTIGTFYEPFIDPKSSSSDKAVKKQSLTSPKGRSKGLTSQTGVYRLKPEYRGKISNETINEFKQIVGLTPAGEARIPVSGEARSQFGTVLQGVTKIYLNNVANVVVREKIENNNQALADIGAGKSSLMFSKSFDLGLEASSDHNSLLEIQFSKKKRLEYENVLKKKRPELKDIPKQVENLFDWADNLDIEDNKKPKYKKLALFYTANGYTVFPEDGYKIEEVARLAAKNKIDPYAYSNPDELINKYTEEVLAVKVNPDNVPELSNKEVFDDVVIYDVVDSRKGQRAVRNIVDSEWGEKANPWCLIARNKKVENQIIDDYKTKAEAEEHSETIRKYWYADSFVTFDKERGRWLVIKGLDFDAKPSDELSSAWTEWKANNMDGEGYGYKIAFQKGKLLSFRDGGQSTNDDGDYEADPDRIEDGEIQWWDRFDKPTDNLTINLGKDKDTGYKIIGSMDYEGYSNISGYGEGDFMSRKNNYKLYNVEKKLVEAKTFKDGKISSSTKISFGKMIINGAKTVEQVDNKYIEGKLVLSEFTSKKVSKGKSVLTKYRETKEEYLSDELRLRDVEEFRYKDGDSNSTRSIKLMTTSPGSNASQDYYRETTINGVKVVNLDKRAELEDIKKSNIQFSKSVKKAAITNNNMLPQSQRLTDNFTNQDVLNRMSDIDNEVREAELRFSKSVLPELDREFNKIIENKTNINSEKILDQKDAGKMGKKKGKFNFFIPPSAEDFVGLLYATLGKGKKGDAQMRFYKENLLDPYAKAMANVTRDRNTLGRDFKALKKQLKIIPKDLKKELKGSLYTKEEAVRVYIWDAIGATIPGLGDKNVKKLVDIVKADKKLEQFAIEVMKLNKGSAYAKPGDSWETGTITTDLLEALNTTRRKIYLERWQQNVDTIFSKDNLNKLEAGFGKSYRIAMEDILKRMETGRNRTHGMDTMTGRFTDWINGSTAAIMFFNSRSAVLQVISFANFINLNDNNIIAAGKAFGNQPQFWSDFLMLFNSEFLTERRDGLKININESDIADVAKEKGVRGVIGKILKLGFTPTQLADSFAIAIGGASFYRNRLKSLIKGGMDPVAAEKQAMIDFRETAEESQQSSRPDKISQQQSGPLGRIVLAFANTPAQYARIIKKSASDLKNKRGDAKTHVANILYYSFLQNLLFNALQQALFSVAFGDDEEELNSSEARLNSKRKEEKYYKVANGMVDSVVRGTGVYGAVFTVVKNVLFEIYRETKKKNTSYGDVAVKELLKISPPISSKVQKVMSAGRTFDWDIKKIKTLYNKKGLSFDNPAILAGANVVSAATNVPLDRLIKKVTNINAALNTDLEAYQQISLALGWSEWELGLEQKKNSTTSTSRGSGLKGAGLKGSGLKGSGF